MKNVNQDSQFMVAHLMNQLAEAQIQLSRAQTKENEELIMLRNENKCLRKENSTFRQEQCEWVCLLCRREFYGPAAIEKGTFKCMVCKPESFCVPKMFFVQPEENAEDILAELQKKVS